MGSSANISDPPDKGSGTQQSGNHSSTPRLSYARIVQKHRESLMKTESELRLTPDDTDASKTTKIMHSNVWRVGGSPASASSVFFDLSSRTEKLSKILNHLASRFGDNCGAQVHREGPRVIVEMFFEASASLQDALTNGVTFSDGVVILPCLALSSDAQVKKVRLSNLPFMNSKRLLEGITQSLRLYGTVLDCGIYRDADSGLYMGNGFAVLDRQPIPNEQPFNDMSHAVQWCTTNDCFYASWASMALHCSRCHVEGHHVRNCPEHPRSFRSCWTCGKAGHLSYDCPSKATNGRAGTTKKRRRTNRNDKSVAIAPLEVELADLLPPPSPPPVTPSQSPSSPLNKPVDSQADKEDIKEHDDSDEEMGDASGTDDDSGDDMHNLLGHVEQALTDFVELQTIAENGATNAVIADPLPENWHAAYPMTDEARAEVVQMTPAVQVALAAHLREYVPEIQFPARNEFSRTRSGRIVRPTEKVKQNHSGSSSLQEPTPNLTYRQ